MDHIEYPFNTKKAALDTARRITRYLSAKGCNQIIGIIKYPDGWRVSIPSDVAAVWPGACDIATGS